MTIIKQQDLIDSVADALQFISYYHPVDFVQAVHRAWEMEQNPAAKDAMAQILINSRMCAMGHRPICQDTGIVTVFIEIGVQRPPNLKKKNKQILLEFVTQRPPNSKESTDLVLTCDTTTTNFDKANRLCWSNDHQF